MVNVLNSFEKDPFFYEEEETLNEFRKFFGINEEE